MYQRKIKIVAVVLCLALASGFSACKGKHTLVSVAPQEADCTQAGNIGYWQCSDCGAVFADEDGEREITLSQTVLPALGHEYVYSYSNHLGDCTSEGVDVSVCTRCGNMLETAGSPSEHQFGAYRQTKKPTCTEDGEEKRICAVCNAVESRSVPSLGHEYVYSYSDHLGDCTNEGSDIYVCSRCGDVEKRTGTAAEHVFGEFVQTKAPACTEDGEETRSCTVCGIKESVVLPATGHSWGTDNVCTKCSFRIAATEGLTYTYIESYGGYAVSGENVTAAEVTVPVYEDGLPIVAIANNAFESHDQLTSLNIYGQITVIGQYAFHGCISLTEITIGDSVERIGVCAFYGCDSLERLSIGKNVKEIGNSAFYGCTSLRKITVSQENAVYRAEGNCLIQGTTLIVGSVGAQIPSYITEISDNAFIRMSKLKTLTLPSCLTKIGDFAFLGTGLTKIVFEGTKAQWNAVEKGKEWNREVAAFTVVCTDGEIRYGETDAS